MKIDRITIGNIPIDLFTIDSLHEQILQTVRDNRKRIFLHANAHLIALANTDAKWLIDFFNDNDHSVMCDGSGVQLGARLTRQQVPVKIPYNTWMWEFATFSSAHDLKVFFLGSDERTIDLAVSRLKTHAPKLNIAGYHHGYFNKHINSPANLAIIENINHSRANILFVGFGMPGQELWVKENAARLQVNAIFTCGGAFDFFAGNKSVAPLIFRKLYLEWLYRLMLEPKRLLSRYTLGNAKFLWAIGKDLFKRM